MTAKRNPYLVISILLGWIPSASFSMINYNRLEDMTKYFISELSGMAEKVNVNVSAEGFLEEFSKDLPHFFKEVSKVFSMEGDDELIANMGKSFEYIMTHHLSRSAGAVISSMIGPSMLLAGLVSTAMGGAWIALHLVTQYFNGPPVLTRHSRGLWSVIGQRMHSLDEILKMIEKEVIIGKKERNRLSSILKMWSMQIKRNLPMSSLLVVGPPGSGKRSLIDALLKALPVLRYKKVSAASFRKYSPQEAIRQIDTLFEEAQASYRNANTPMVIVLEGGIEKMFPKHSSTGGGDTDTLLRMQHIFNKTGHTEHPDYCCMIGTTNKPSAIDEKGLRRFPQRIELGLPKGDAIKKLFEAKINKEGQHYSDVMLRFKLNKAFYASLLPYLETLQVSGADLTHLVNRLYSLGYDIETDKVTIDREILHRALDELRQHKKMSSGGHTDWG